MIQIYGIPNCGSVKKALTWMDNAGIAYTFHNFKKEGLDAALLDQWLASPIGGQLLNKQGLMWKKVPEERRTLVLQDPQALRALLLETPTIIKRPVIVFETGDIVVGVNEDRWAQLIQA